MRSIVHRASSIKLARQCRHAWALRHLDGIEPVDFVWEQVLAYEEWREASRDRYGTTLPEQPKPKGSQRSTALGKRVHTYADWWLVGGEEADAGVYGPRRTIDWESLPGQVFQQLTPHLPPRGSVRPGDVEREFDMVLEGLKFHGTLDVAPRVGATLEVWDHKTSGDIRKYALLPDAAAKRFGVPERSLLNDLQACLYALATARRTKHMPPSITCRWNYTETKKIRRSLAVVQVIPTQHALRVVRDAATVARELETYASSADAPPNPLACGEYGGCWYRANGHCSAPRPIGKLIRMAELEAQKAKNGKMAKSFAELKKEVEAKKSGGAAKPAPAAAKATPAAKGGIRPPPGKAKLAPAPVVEEPEVIEAEGEEVAEDCETPAEPVAIDLAELHKVLIAAAGATSKALKYVREAIGE